MGNFQACGKGKTQMHATFPDPFSVGSFTFRKSQLLFAVMHLRKNDYEDMQPLVKSSSYD